jgi:hypothetical protein
MTENIVTGAFGVLKPMKLRVYFFRGTSGLLRTLQTFKKAYNLENDPELQKEPIEISEGRTINFKYFEVEGNRFYTFLIGGKRDEIDDREAVLRYGGGVYDLVAHKKTGAMIYIDYEAIPVYLKFGAGRFDKFHPIFLHSQEQVEKYIESKNFFKDEQELLYRLLQIQNYVENNVTARGTFKQKEREPRQNKEDGDEAIEEERPPRHHQRREESHREVHGEHKPRSRAPAKQFNPRNKHRDEPEQKSKPKPRGWNRQKEDDERIPSPRKGSSSDDEDVDVLKAKLKYLEAKAKKSHK